MHIFRPPAPALLLVFLFSSAVTPAWAISFITFDARSMSMGGTGVATARSHNASLFNPALLIDANPARYNRLHMHAYAGGRLLDRNQFIDTAKMFRDRYEGDPEDWFEGQANLTPSREMTSEPLRATSQNLRTLQADANQLANKPLRVSGSYGLAFSYPQARWAVGGYYREFMVLGSILRIADEDNASLERVSTTLDLLANLVDDVTELYLQMPRDEAAVRRLTLDDLASLAGPTLNSLIALDPYLNYQALQNDLLERTVSNNAEDYLRYPLPNELTSALENQGAEVTEQGLSIARTFTPDHFNGPIKVAMTLKQVGFTTIHYRQPLTEFDLSAYRESEHRRRNNHFNMDLGALYHLDAHWQLGLVVRNLFRREFATVLDDVITMRPIARAGLGYIRNPWRLSLDLDITRNDPLGFDPDQQYLSLGAEWFAWRNTALRGGVRTNLVDGETLPSIGFGLGGRYTHLDLALAHSLNGDEYGVALQAGISLNP